MSEPPKDFPYVASQSDTQIEKQNLVIEVESGGSEAEINEVSNKINNIICNNNSDPAIECDVDSDININMNVLRHMESTCSTNLNSTNVLDNSNGQIDIEEPNIILSELKAKNAERLIIAQININAVENKFQSLVSLIKDNVDIIMISETKIDDSFPLSQFKIDGFSSPFRLDRNSHGGGIMIFFP